MHRACDVWKDRRGLNGNTLFKEGAIKDSRQLFNGSRCSGGMYP